MGLQDYELPDDNDDYGFEDHVLDNLPAGQRNRLLVEAKTPKQHWGVGKWALWSIGMFLSFIWCIPWAILTVLVAITIIFFPFAIVPMYIGAAPMTFLIAKVMGKAN